MGQKYSLISNYAVNGNDLKTVKGTVFECHYECSRNQDCKGFAWANNGSNTCWLKTTNQDGVQDNQYTTFVREAFGNIEESHKKNHHNYALYIILALILVLVIGYLNRDRLRKLVN